MPGNLSERTQEKDLNKEDTFCRGGNFKTGLDLTYARNAGDLKQAEVGFRPMLYIKLQEEKEKAE
ncbi:MAG: hypothetical protein RSB87_03010 [Clostridia bacterium]